jgi:hypothetical protein
VAWRTRTNPIRNASPVAALHRCGRYSSTSGSVVNRTGRPSLTEVSGNPALTHSSGDVWLEMLVQYAGYRGSSETDSDLDVFFFTGGTKNPTRFTAERTHCGRNDRCVFLLRSHSRA